MNKMKEWKYEIKDAMGIHARPAGYIIKEASKYPCKIMIENKGKEVDAKRILAVMSLGVKYGETIILRTEGEQEDEAMAKMSEVIRENL